MAQKDTCLSVEEARQLIMDHRYIIDKFVGAGAMACVYKARERDTPNIYALKILREEFYLRKGFLEIFEKEAHHMRDLQYPNMVRFYKFENEAHIAYILMDYVEGEPLTKYIREARESGNMIPLNILVRMMAQIARAINYLHDEEVIHRDIKPGNILLGGEDQSAFLTDLGIAGGFDAQEALKGAGTPSYMPYEQQVGETVDHTVDIYAFAVMLFETFTGRKPFLPPKGLSIPEAREAMRELHRSAEVPSLVELRPELPEEIDEIFQHALAKEPSKRYQDVLDFAQDIHELLKPQLSEDLKNFADIKEQEIQRAEETEAKKQLQAQTAVRQEGQAAKEEPKKSSWMIWGAVALVVILLLGIWGVMMQGSTPETDLTAISVEETEEPNQTPIPTPFLFGEETAIILSGAESLGFGDDLDIGLSFAVVHGGKNVPLRLNADDSYYLKVGFAEDTLENYMSYGIVFAYQDASNTMILRIDKDEQVWSLEDWQAGETTSLADGNLETLPTSLYLSKRDKYVYFEIDGQNFQQEVDETRQGQLGLWLDIEDSTAIRMTQLEFGMVNVDVENSGDFELPVPDAKHYVLRDIEALLATGATGTYEVQCPEFIEVYDKLERYKAYADADFASEAIDLANQAQEGSVLIHGECIGRDTTVVFTFDIYSGWEDSLKALLAKDS